MSAGTLASGTLASLGVCIASDFKGIGDIGDQLPDCKGIRDQLVEICRVAHNRVAEFPTHDAYVLEREKLTLVARQVMMDIYKEMCDVKTGGMPDLPVPQITGSMSYGMSYAESDVGFAWICDSFAQAKKLRDRFVSLYQSTADPKQAKPGSLLSAAIFDKGFQFETKHGLPWIPFFLKVGSVVFNFDQAFRLREAHELIQSAAERFWSHFERNSPQLLDFMHVQHWLLLVKYQCLKASTTNVDRKDDYEKAYDHYHSIYMKNGATMNPDLVKLAELLASQKNKEDMIDKELERILTQKENEVKSIDGAVNFESMKTYMKKYYPTLKWNQDVVFQELTRTITSKQFGTNEVGSHLGWTSMHIIRTEYYRHRLVLSRGFCHLIEQELEQTKAKEPTQNVRDHVKRIWMYHTPDERYH